MDTIRPPTEPMPAPERQMTLGEYRVGITFNPGGNPKVDEIKKLAAEFIDLCQHYRPQGPSDVDHGEANRLLALAQTHIEDAAMWAVKAVTKQPRS